VLDLLYSGAQHQQEQSGLPPDVSRLQPIAEASTAGVGAEEDEEGHLRDDCDGSPRSWLLEDHKFENEQ